MERNQGAFPNNVISLSRNCDHGGDVFSGCLHPCLCSLPHLNNIVPIRHAASPFIYPEGKVQMSCFPVNGA